MFRYVLRRIAAVVPILFGVSIVCFSFVHLAPGDAISALTGDNATREVVAQLRQIYGYDQPLPIQYLRWLGRILSGDLGHSIMTGRSVLSEVIPAALHTAMLASVAIVLSLLVGIHNALVDLYLRTLLFQSDALVQGLHRIYFGFAAQHLHKFCHCGFALGVAARGYGYFTFCFRRGNGNVDRRHWTKRDELFFKLASISYNQHLEIFLVNVLIGNA